MRMNKVFFMKRLCYILLIGVFLASCNLSLTNFRMTNTSMLPTISVGSVVKITKQVDSLDYGDIVVFYFDGKVNDGASEEVWKSEKKTGTEKIFEIQGVIVSRIVGLPGDSIAVEKEFCTINGKKNKYRLIQKGISNEDVEDFLRNLVAEYEEQLPNKKIIHIYRFEISSKDIKEYMGTFDDKQMYKDMETIKIPDNQYFMMGDFRDNKYDSRYIGAIPREQIMGKVIKIKQKQK